MTDSEASFIAILFGLGVFAVIVAVGWRSVQHRRIVRLQGANGQETIILAGEDDEVVSVESSSRETTPATKAPAARLPAEHEETPDQAAGPKFD
jgi:ABC-type hemin transport system substrate-binding protein